MKIKWSGLGVFILFFVGLHTQESSSLSRNFNGAKLGVYVGNLNEDLNRFENWLGHPVDLVLGYTGDRTWDDADPGWALSAEFIGSGGRPIAWSLPLMPRDGGAAMLRVVATGARNNTYRHWAQKILASRSADNDAIYIRTTWELGGEWFPWTAAAIEDPQAYIGAFQQFAASFHATSGRFKIVWDFSGDRGAIERWYPGDIAVDVISQDVYWDPEWQGNDPVAAFQHAVSGKDRGLTWMANFAALHKKRMAITEWGVPGAAGNIFDGATYIKLMMQWISNNDVVYANYWNAGVASGYDGLLSDDNPILSAAALRKAYATGVPNP